MKYFWHFYILLFLSLGVGRMIEKVVAESGGFASRYLPLIAVLVLSVGIYGSIKNKPILYRWLWLAVLAFSSIASLMAIAISAYLAFSVGSGALRSIALLLSIAFLLIPAQIKLKNYASKANGCWSS